eukprot:355935-Chlamydomonas_euryale.AAC.2
MLPAVGLGQPAQHIATRIHIIRRCEWDSVPDICFAQHPHTCVLCTDEGSDLVFLKMRRWYPGHLIQRRTCRAGRGLGVEAYKVCKLQARFSQRSCMDHGTAG